MLKKIFFCIFCLYFCLTPHLLWAKQPTNTLFLEGVRLLNEKDFKKAEKYFKKVIKAIPEHYPSYFNLSLLNILQKDYKTSLTNLQKAKELNPFDTRVYQMLTTVYALQEDYPESKKCLTSMITKNPQDITPHKKLGLIYLKENDINSATAEFTMIKNLAPRDIEGNLLLSVSYALNENLPKALEKLSKIQGDLKDPTHLAYYALILEKLPPNDELTKEIITSISSNIISADIQKLTPMETFEIPEVAKRMADKLKKEADPIQTEETRTAKKVKKKIKLPYGLKGTITQTIENYERFPKATSPINGTSFTSNIKVEGKTKKNQNFSAEFESFYNRWDETVLDFYKINVNKRSNYEVDVGKFSAKHFPTLVSYPTVKDGVRLWKKITLPEFKPEEIPLSPDMNGVNKINLGELYRKGYVDTRLFKSMEFTVLMGRTLKAIDLGKMKEKNENTFETSGQFEQWTNAYRVFSEFNSFMDIGASLAFTVDRPTSAEASSTTDPVQSTAMGVDGGFKFLDKKLTFDWELAYGNYDEDLNDITNKHKKDKAWLMKLKYKPYNPLTLAYEQKAVERNFKVEGASQTEDKISHTFDIQYKPLNPDPWSLKSFAIKYKPEQTNFQGGGSAKKTYRTLQPIASFKLPQDASYTIDYKFYSEHDKCGCTNYKTTTLKNSIDWEIKPFKTTFKPSYTFERKDDFTDSETDEKREELVFAVENNSFEKWTLKYSDEREVKNFTGFTTKSYHQYIRSFEAKYGLIPYRCDVTFKASRDLKDPSDTNKTDISTLSLNLDYTSKDRDNKLTFKYERKNNIYKPWSDSSAYKQNYIKAKYTRKF